MNRDPIGEFVTGSDQDGERLDRVIPAKSPGISRTRARQMIEAGSVFVDRIRVRVCSRPVKAGQLVEIFEPVEVQSTEAPRLVFENLDIAVISKPARMPVEPTRQGIRGTLQEWLKTGIEGGGFITHRLDAPTSGLIAVARSRSAQAELNRLFANREIARNYLAVVSPAPDWERMTFESPLDGREAVTHAMVTDRSPRAALLWLELETGRTRQIRRHLSGAGFPVAGDSESGGIRASRLLLHAAELRFCWKGENIHLREPAPDAWKPELERLGFTNPSLEGLLPTV